MLKRFIVFSIPILILISMLISPILTLTQGTEVILKTVPIDPRDIFRGDYIILNYEISEVDKNMLSNDLKNNFDKDNMYGVEVYTALEKDSSGYYKVKSVSQNKPDSDIYLKGVLSSYRMYDEPITDDTNAYGYDGDSDKFHYVYRVEYEIDKYFVPENSGKEYEDASQNGDILAIVKVFKGNAMLKSIKIKQSEND